MANIGQITAIKKVSKTIKLFLAGFVKSFIKFSNSLKVQSIFFI